MDVRNFFIARDLLYAGGALTGIVLGYALSFFRRDMTTRSRNRRLALVLFVFSGALAAFAAAIVLFPREIFAVGGLLLLVGLCVPVFALAVLFPRAAAYPLILAGGLLAVWLGYSFLRFPLAAGNSFPLLYVYHEGDTAYSVRLPAGPDNNRDRATTAVLRINGKQPPLEIEGVLIGFHPRYPLIGGTARGLITFIRRGTETLYTAPAPETSAVEAWHSLPARPGIVFQTVSGTVPLDAIPGGAHLTVYFSRETRSLELSR
jgi:hypothetical protein